MIGHKDIGANKPMRSVTPKIALYLMSYRTFEPRDSVLCANRQEYEIIFLQRINRGVVRIFAFDGGCECGMCIFNRHAFYSEDRFVCCGFRPVRRQALRDAE